MGPGQGLEVLQLAATEQAALRVPLTRDVARAGSVRTFRRSAFEAEKLLGHAAPVAADRAAVVALDGGAVTGAGQSGPPSSPDDDIPPHP